VVNRAAVILKYKASFIQWINESDPYNDDPGITMEEANEDRTVYLISQEDAEAVDEWIKANYEALFKAELGGWYEDEALWPQNISQKMFHDWFEVECHTVLIDTVGDPILNEE